MDPLFSKTKAVISDFWSLIFDRTIRNPVFIFWFFKINDRKLPIENSQKPLQNWTLSFVVLLTSLFSKIDHLEISLTKDKGSVRVTAFVNFWSTIFDCWFLNIKGLTFDLPSLFSENQVCIYPLVFIIRWSRKSNGILSFINLQTWLVNFWSLKIDKRFHFAERL